MKKGLLMMLTLLLAGAGCVSSGAQQEDIVFGGVFALSGVGSAIGQEEERGARLAIDEINAAGGINGKQIRWVPEDVSLDKLSETVSAVQKLLQIDGIDVLIGPTWDEPAAQLIPVMEEAKIPVVMPDATDSLEEETSYAYAFSTWVDNAVGIRELLRYAQRNELGRIAIIKPTAGGFWEYTARIMDDAAAEFGVEVIAEFDVGNPLEKDFRTVLTQLKQTEADAVFAVVSDYNQCSLLRQMKELDIPLPVLATESAGNKAALESCAELIEGTMFFSTPKQSEAFAAFAQRYEEAYDMEVAFPTAAAAYDAVRAAAAGMESAAEEGLALRDAIAGLEIKGTLLETIVFDEIGFIDTPEDAFEMQTVKGGAFVPAE